MRKILDQPVFPITRTVFTHPVEVVASKLRHHVHRLTDITVDDVHGTQLNSSSIIDDDLVEEVLGILRFDHHRDHIVIRSTAAWMNRLDRGTTESHLPSKIL